jgi:hypothetical protein
MLLRWGLFAYLYNPSCYPVQYPDKSRNKEKSMKRKRLIDSNDLLLPRAPSGRRAPDARLLAVRLYPRLCLRALALPVYRYRHRRTPPGALGRPIINLAACPCGHPCPPCPVNQPGKAFADTYHGKVVPLDAARQLVSIKSRCEFPTSSR